MFAGSYEHSLDDKGRLVLPAGWRRQLEGGGFLAPWEDCLALWPADVFWGVADVIQTRMEQTDGDDEAVDTARRSYRYFMSSAREVKPDGAGRIVVPPTHRTAAGITRDTTLIGFRDRIEVWDRGRWTGQEEQAQQHLAQVVRRMRL